MVAFTDRHREPGSLRIPTPDDAGLMDDVAMSLVIRPFEPADAAATSALIAETMRRSNAADYPPDRLEALIAYFTPAKLIALAAERHCLVAAFETAVVGTAARDGDELLTFFVHPDHQGTGIGARLLEELERDALASGVCVLRVEASITGTGFYERQGYQRTGAVVQATAGLHVALTRDIRKGAG